MKLGVLSVVGCESDARDDYWCWRFVAAVFVFAVSGVFDSGFCALFVWFLVGFCWRVLVFCAPCFDSPVLDCLDEGTA